MKLYGKRRSEDLTFFLKKSKLWDNHKEGRRGVGICKINGAEAFREVTNAWVILRREVSGESDGVRIFRQ